MASSADHGFLGRGFESHYPPITICFDLPHVELENTLLGIPRKWNCVYIDIFARVSARPSTPPVQGRGVLQGLAFVGNWITFYQWSNGLTVYNYLNKWRRRQDIPGRLLSRGFASHLLPIINFYDFPMSNLKNTLPGIPRDTTAWILIHLSVYPADLPSRRPRGETFIRLSLGRQYRATFYQWSNELIPSNYHNTGAADPRRSRPPIVRGPHLEWVFGIF